LINVKLSNDPATVLLYLLCYKLDISQPFIPNSLRDKMYFIQCIFNKFSEALTTSTHTQKSYILSPALNFVQQMFYQERKSISWQRWKETAQNIVMVC